MTASPRSTLEAAPLELRWDIFCQVIDNHGDLGVCWRLARSLGALGMRVRLWVDDASALAWMAPAGHPQVQVLPWPLTAPGDLADVVIEAFGCELPHSYQVMLGQNPQSCIWLNLEYLSAEAYVARMHGLPSPVLSGPAKGCTKWFFYPGFTAQTGGLLREPGLPMPSFAPGAQPLTVSLFCYEPVNLAAMLQRLSELAHGVHLKITAGRAQQAVAALGQIPALNRLSCQALPHMPQDDFDAMLQTSDLNFVRGEDSLVRALWAGKPFVWQIYPQHDGAHWHKLTAFLDGLSAPTVVRAWHLFWNADEAAPCPPLTAPDWQIWQIWARETQAILRQQTDLTRQLIDFVVKKR
jgi:uncharacterized repeat protein (TIGR03837 family)